MSTAGTSPPNDTPNDHGLQWPDLTVLELAIAVVCTRKPRSARDDIAAEVGRWFGKGVAPMHLEMPVHRMLARAELVACGDRYAATDLGRTRAESAARSLVYLFFRDRYFFDVSKLLEITFREDGSNAH